MTRQGVLWVWAAVAVAFVACEALSLVTRRRTASIATVLDLLSAAPLGMVVLFVGWMWLGWHLFAR